MSVRSAALAFGALVVGSALVVDPAGLAPFGPSKWLLVSTVGVLVATLSLRHRSTRCHRQSWWAWVGLLALLTASASVNGDVRVALLGHPDRHLGVITWLLLFALFCAGQQLTDRVTMLCRAAVVAAAGIGTYSLWELLVGRPVAVATTTRRLLGPFGSAAVLGAACCLLGPIALSVALDRSGQRWWRRVAGLAAALVAVALIGSGTRGAWVGAGVAIIIAVMAARPSRRTVVWCATGLAVALSVVAPRLSAVSSRDDSASRLDEWRVAIRVVERNPVLGVGPEGYRIAVAEGVDDAYERAHRRDTVLPDRAHDGPLDVTLMGGIGAGLLYVALVGFVGWRAWRLLRTGNASNVGIGLGVIAYGVQQLFLFPLAELDPTWWVLAGVVVALTSSAGNREDHPSVVPLVAGFVAVAMLVLGVLDVAADRLARTALRSTDPDAAIDAARRAVSLRPDDIRYRLVAAEVALDRGTLSDVDRAITEARRATDWSLDDPFATDELATAMLQRAVITGNPEDKSAALAHWQQLVARDPHRASWQLQLGRAAALADVTSVARQAWTIAADLGEPGAQALLDALGRTS